MYWNTNHFKGLLFWFPKINHAIKATVSQNHQEIIKKKNGGRTEAKPNHHDPPISTLKQIRYFALLNI